MTAHSALASASNEVPNVVDTLLRDGWTILRNILPLATVRALDADLDATFDRTLFSKGGFYGERTKRFGRLLIRTPLATDLVQHALVLNVVEHLLGPWCDTIQLNLGQAIEIHPGAPAQLPHRDQDMWRGAKGETEYLVNIMWPLTPFTADNGATLIYPDSHRLGALTDHDPGMPITATCNPGDAILFLGSTLHSGGANRSRAPRRGIIISYCLGWLKPYENQWLAYPPELARRFSPDLAALVGYRQHRPNLGNIEGLCPSLLLGDGLPDRIGAVDALRPDQALQLAEFLAHQSRDQLSTPTAA